MLTNYLKSQIKQHSLEYSNEEVCGFILSNNQIVKARNTSFNKSKNFSIHPQDYISAENSGNIVAIYHSHPSKNDKFSEFDKLSAQNHNKPYIMYCIKTDTFHEFYPEGYTNKYIGLKFDYKLSNCFTLIKDFYKNELNIEIYENENIKELKDKWYEKNSNLFDEMWKLNTSFFDVNNKDETKKYDVLCFNYFDMTKSAHHLGIYLEDDTFLHHPHHQYSKIDILDEQYKRKITNIIRHESFIN